MDNRDRRYSRPMWVPWAMTSAALFVVAAVAYALGTRHEVVLDGADHVTRGHFGFGIFWLFLLFWFVFGFRRAYWWGGPPYYRPWRYRRFRRIYDDEDEEQEWREWHRREHQRTATTPPVDDARGQGQG